MHENHSESKEYLTTPNKLSPLWIFCRDNCSSDISELTALIDLHIDKINKLEGRAEDISMPPLLAVLSSRKSVSRKFDEVRALIARGANVNCLDEFGASALAYLTKFAFIEDLHSDIIEFLEEHGGEVVKGRGTDFFFNLDCCDDSELSSDKYF